MACTETDTVPGSVGEALGFADPDDPEAVFRVRGALEQSVEERIVTCMADLGFDYEPRGLAPDPRAGGEMTNEEYRALYGYGMMSSWEQSLLEEEGWGDPNDRVRESMDEATQLAWHTALVGEHPDDPEIRDGCRAEAEDEINDYLFTDVWAELERELDDLEARIAADPRTIAAEARWADCMAEAGYPFRDEEEAIHFISDEVHDRWEREPHPETGTLTTYRYAIPPWFVETETWAELVELELDIVATADACGEDPEVRDEYEQRFLEEHADLLDQLRELRR